MTLTLCTTLTLHSGLVRARGVRLACGVRKGLVDVRVVRLGLLDSGSDGQTKGGHRHESREDVQATVELDGERHCGRAVYVRVCG